MRYDLIPTDIYYFYIYKFLFIECNKCNKQIHYSNIITNCKVFTYFSVFDDDYDLNNEVESFDYICKPCLKLYDDRYVLNYDTIKFKWISNIK